jgi:hypothetical protein
MTGGRAAAQYQREGGGRRATAPREEGGGGATSGGGEWGRCGCSAGSRGLGRRTAAQGPFRWAVVKKSYCGLWP